MPELQPSRYILEPAEVSACFAHLRMIPPSTPFYASLPGAKPDIPERLRADDGNIEPAARAAFEILADPASVAKVRHLLPESGVELETRVVGGRTGPQLVLVAQLPDGTWDMALVSDRAQALAAIDGIIGFGDAKAVTGGFDITLSIAALGTFAAMADMIRDEDLQSRLNRVPAPLSFLTAAPAPKAVLAMAKRGLENPDLRSAVSRFETISNGATATIKTPAKITKGLADLASAGLLDEDGRLSADGVALALAFVNAKPLGAIDVMHMDEEGLVLDGLVYALLPDAILIGSWEMDAEALPKALRIVEMSPGDALAVADAVLTP